MNYNKYIFFYHKQSSSNLIKETILTKLDIYAHTNSIATYNSDIVLANGSAGKETVGQILTSNDGIKWSSNNISFMIEIQCIASNIPL